MKRVAESICAALLLLLLPGASAEAADSLRCGQDLLHLGASRYEVRSACGEPDDQHSRIELRSIRVHRRVACDAADKERRCHAAQSRTVEVTVDEWLYDFGRLQFIQHVTFEQGRLVRVTSGKRGRKH